MSADPLERIETMCIQNRALLVAIGECLLKGTRDKQAKDLRRAIGEVYPWRNDSAPEQQEQDGE